MRGAEACSGNTRAARRHRCDVLADLRARSDVRERRLRPRLHAARWSARAAPCYPTLHPERRWPGRVLRHRHAATARRPRARRTRRPASRTAATPATASRSRSAARMTRASATGRSRATARRRRARWGRCPASRTAAGPASASRRATASFPRARRSPTRQSCESRAWTASRSTTGRTAPATPQGCTCAERDAGSAANLPSMPLVAAMLSVGDLGGGRSSDRRSGPAPTRRTTLPRRRSGRPRRRCRRRATLGPPTRSTRCRPSSCRRARSRRPTRTHTKYSTTTSPVEAMRLEEIARTPDLPQGRARSPASPASLVALVDRRRPDRLPRRDGRLRADRARLGVDAVGRPRPGDATQPRRIVLPALVDRVRLVRRRLLLGRRRRRSPR